MQKIIIHQISLSPDALPEYAMQKAEAEARKSGVNAKAERICRVSVDSRKKNDVKTVYSVILECESISDAQIRSLNASPFCEPVIEIKRGKGKPGKIAVIGFGPAGIFASLILSENGYDVTVFERGEDVIKRSSSVDRFISDGVLNTESNVQFGAGGAGTFSDGKLITRINDPVCSYVLKRLAEFGAPESILYSARPHIGSDILKTVIDNITTYIRKTGTDIRFKTRIDSVNEYSDGIKLRFSEGEEYFDAAVLACGHSARDTYAMLYENGTALQAKPFSVGMRIEHLQEDIDRAMYGQALDKYRGYLPHAEYNLSKRCTLNGVERGVYTFCMCPGGEVICASTEQNGIVTNGMSESGRSGLNANSAVCVSVFPSDCGSGVLDGIEFQRRIERRAYEAAGGRFRVPVQTVGSFLKGKANKPSNVIPSCKNGFVLSSDNSVFPGFVTEMIGIGLNDFGKKIVGFDSDYAVLSAPETRTSSPLRILRDQFGRSVSNKSLYPCGEGAGYAGGITSAACDGIKTALQIAERFAPKK
ncbi:MAG: hypothetical protein II135_07925 [Clostridia bacterium]|nr:hypothetical protein [Clostridia bacterium]